MKNDEIASGAGSDRRYGAVLAHKLLHGTFLGDEIRES
jgi:hypothetical protein